MSAENLDLPKYRCHKVVGAAKIIKIELIVGGDIRAPMFAGWSKTTLFEGQHKGFEPDVVITIGTLNGIDQEIHQTAPWTNRHRPEVGGYLVQYEDGYTSYSPAKVFEEGYTSELSESRRVVAHEDFADWLDAVAPGISDGLQKYWAWLGIPKEEWGSRWHSDKGGMLVWDGNDFVPGEGPK